jgi:O-antigen/teichoic acid export membrane protein
MSGSRPSTSDGPAASDVPAGLSLRANCLWTVLGNVVYAGCQGGMLVVLAKIGSSRMVGQFALGLAVATPVIMFANLQLRGVQATDARGQYRFGDYLGLRLISTALAFVVISGIALLSRYRWDTTLVVVAVGLAKTVESVSDVIYGLLQQHERMDRIAKSVMLKGLLSLAALSAATALTDSVLWGAVGLVVAWGLVLLCYDIPSGALVLTPMPGGDSTAPVRGRQAFVRPQWQLRRLAGLAWLALPLGCVMLLISLQPNIPRYFIEQHGERALGIFAAIAYLQVAATTVVNALGQAASPRLSKYYTTGDTRAYRTLLFKLVGCGVLVGVAGVVLALVAGREVLSLLFRPEYARQDVLVLLMVGTGIANLASFLWYGMMAARYFRVQLPLFAFVVGMTALACAWLVPSDGLRGAATALIIAAVVQAAGSALIIVYALRARHGLQPRPWSHARTFKRILREQVPYDADHY